MNREKEHLLHNDIFGLPRAENPRRLITPRVVRQFPPRASAIFFKWKSNPRVTRFASHPSHSRRSSIDKINLPEMSRPSAELSLPFAIYKKAASSFRFPPRRFPPLLFKWRRERTRANNQHKFFSLSFLFSPFFSFLTRPFFRINVCFLRNNEY